VKEKDRGRESVSDKERGKERIETVCVSERKKEG
jgi:hypothetical protein